MKLRYLELFKLWYENNDEIKLKTISLIAGIIGGNNLEIKRNFLENNGFSVIISFLNDQINQKKNSKTVVKNKITVKLL